MVPVHVEGAVISTRAIILLTLGCLLFARVGGFVARLLRPGQPARPFRSQYARACRRQDASSGMKKGWARRADVPLAEGKTVPCALARIDA